VYLKVSLLISTIRTPCGDEYRKTAGKEKTTGLVLHLRLSGVFFKSTFTFFSDSWIVINYLWLGKENMLEINSLDFNFTNREVNYTHWYHHLNELFRLMNLGCDKLTAFIKNFSHFIDQSKHFTLQATFTHTLE